MVANTTKCHLIFLGLKQHLEIENKSINVTRSLKLLGINVDDELKFNKHVKTLCLKVSKNFGAFFSQISALFQYASSMTIKGRRTGERISTNLARKAFLFLVRFLMISKVFK